MKGILPRTVPEGEAGYDSPFIFVTQHCGDTGLRSETRPSPAAMMDRLITDSANKTLLPL
jgi:hypothetical protein